MRTSSPKTGTPLEAALAWSQMTEIPIPILCGTKRPPRGFAWKGLQHRRPSEPEIRSWWARWPTAQVGILLGERLVVLDSDGPGAEKMITAISLPRTPTQKTPRPGRHRFFRVESPLRGRVVKAPDGSNLELRGLGQYVVISPSRHPSGNCYEWEISPTEPFALLPREVLDLFPAPGVATPEPGRRKPPAPIQALLDLHPRLRPVFEGRLDPPNDTSGSGRDLVLAHAARKAGLTEAEAAMLMRYAPYPKKHRRTNSYIQQTIRKAYAPRRYAPAPGGYGRVPAAPVLSGAFARFSDKAVRLAYVYAIWALRPSGIVRLGNGEAARLAGLHPDSIHPGDQELVQAGLLRKARAGKGWNRWWVLAIAPTCGEVSSAQVTRARPPATAPEPPSPAKGSCRSKFGAGEPVTHRAETGAGHHLVHNGVKKATSAPSPPSPQAFPECKGEGKEVAARADLGSMALVEKVWADGRLLVCRRLRSGDLVAVFLGSVEERAAWQPPAVLRDESRLGEWPKVKL